jgi:hypothetical protein
VAQAGTELADATIAGLLYGLASPVAWRNASLLKQSPGAELLRFLTV